MAWAAASRWRTTAPAPGVPRTVECPSWSHPTDRCRSGCHISPVGAGVPAKQATRCLAPALPVFAGKPAPTGAVLPSEMRRPISPGQSASRGFAPSTTAHSPRSPPGCNPTAG
ncbi:hypothetical protein DBL03_06865 [Pseudomonas putida]|nr:hypothetical protein DBL03_06865 [Pseudomonas putida]